MYITVNIANFDGEIKCYIHEYPDFKTAKAFFALDTFQESGFHDKIEALDERKPTSKGGDEWHIANGVFIKKLKMFDELKVRLDKIYDDLNLEMAIEEANRSIDGYPN